MDRVNDLDWTKLSLQVQKHSNVITAPGFMFGPIAVQLKAKVAKAVRQKLVKDISKLQKPTELKESDIHKDENETSANVEMVFNCLAAAKKMLFYEFFINPASFSQSVENLFYLSFLIRDARVGIEEDEETSEFMVEPQNPPTAEEMQENDFARLQNVFHFDMAMWKALFCII